MYRSYNGGNVLVWFIRFIFNHIDYSGFQIFDGALQGLTFLLVSSRVLVQTGNMRSYAKELIG